MRLISVTVRGIATAFKGQTATLDFSQLPEGGLIALVGGNGRGKTTFMECSGPATTHRTYPSYEESFAEHIVPGVRDAMSEVVFEVGGVIYRAMVQADPLFGGGRGKTEGYLFRRTEAGTWEPLAGPLVRDYDAAIAKILPPLDVFLASVFARQGGGGSFFTLSKADRRKLFAKLLGLEYLQAKSEACAVLAGKAEDHAERLQLRIVDATDRETRAAARQVEVDALERWRDDVAGKVAALEVAFADVDRAHGAEVTRLAEVRFTNTARDEARGRMESQLVSIRREASTLQHQLAGIDVELEELGDVALIEAAAAEVPAAREVLRLIGLEKVAQHAQHATLDRAIGIAEVELRGLKDEYKTRKSWRDTARAAQDAAAGLDAAEATHRAACEAVTAAEAARMALEKQVEDLEADVEVFRQRTTTRTLAVDGLKRAREAAGLMDRVPGVPECSTCPLTEAARQAAELIAPTEAKIADDDAVIAGLGEDPPARLAALRVELRFAREAKADADATEDAAEAIVRDLRAKKDAAGDVATLEADLEACRVAGTAKAAANVESLAQRDAAVNRLHALAEKEDVAQQEVDRLARIAARMPEVTAATARRREVAAALQGVMLREVVATDELAAAPTSTPVDTTELDQLAPALEGARRTLAEQRQTHSDIVAQHAAKVGAIAELGNPTTELVTLRAQLDEARTIAADWALASRGLGREGAQALEIDAAGPAVTKIANDLLAGCDFGDRFALKIVTTEPLKGKAGTKEVFEVQIVDAEQGRTAKQGSGGEMVILDEALRLAIALYNRQVGGYELGTLWRDETAGALSPENADRYIAMLREAQKLGRFSHVIFIAHQPAVWQQADARVLFQGGQALIEEAA